LNAQLYEHIVMINRVRLAVIFDQEIRVGGGYQQALNAALLVRQLPRDLVEALFFTPFEETAKTLALKEVEVVCFKYGLLFRLLNVLRTRILHPRFQGFCDRVGLRNPLEKLLQTHRIDLVYFLSPCGWAAHLESTNYITTVWDLCHRDHPVFPEVRAGGVLNSRDRNLNSILPGAVGILVDSEISRCNMVRRYGIDEARIHVMPFQASVSSRNPEHSGESIQLDVRGKYKLDTPYVFYPAQFWAHKNHVYILEGLQVLEKIYGLRVGAIFSGGDMGNLEHIKKCVAQSGLADRVRFSGFVSNEEIPCLYRQSVALVMPTYFGPTNLPPLEAFELGVPVLYSDLPGMREQVGDAALLLDLTNPGSLADHLVALMGSESLRNRLIRAGKDRLDEFAKCNRVGVLQTVIEDFRVKRLCWE
jgi:glycosyltransferase involved in cell wall biosynthesis